MSHDTWCASTVLFLRFLGLTVGVVQHDVPDADRNDPCPCGSGKKYKKCCGRRQRAAAG